MPLVSGLFKFLQHRSSLKESSISRHTAYAQPPSRSNNKRGVHGADHGKKGFNERYGNQGRH